MREIDDAHDAEYERQPDTQEEQQCGLGQGVDGLGEQERDEAHIGQARKLA
jgi:hypothetical protein